MLVSEKDFSREKYLIGVDSHLEVSQYIMFYYRSAQVILIEYVITPIVIEKTLDSVARVPSSHFGDIFVHVLQVYF